MRAVVIFYVTDEYDFERMKENHKLPDEKWYLIDDDASLSFYEIVSLLNKKKEAE